MNKQNVTIGLAILILSFSVYNAFDDHDVTGTHMDFFSEVRDFMERGGRNTAEMGYINCLAQNLNSVALNNPTIDCCKTYYDNDEALCMEIDRLHR